MDPVLEGNAMKEIMSSTDKIRIRTADCKKYCASAHL